jgi:hypothetical protein
MPFLALVHLRELHCPECSLLLAPAGARSFLVDETGEAVNFSSEGPPAEMTVEIECPNGHAVTLYVPNEIGAEETLSTPDEAPIGRDAVLQRDVP